MFRVLGVFHDVQGRSGVPENTTCQYGMSSASLDVHDVVLVVNCATLGDEGVPTNFSYKKKKKQLMEGKLRGKKIVKEEHK